MAEHADLLGYLSLDGGLRDHYRDSHMFLHVSWTEGVPQVLFESFAAGLPVVATAVGGVPELAEGRSVLIPPGDADAAVEATRRVASDAALRDELVDAGLECVGRFSLDSEARPRGGALRRGHDGELRTASHQRHPATELGLGRSARRDAPVSDSHGDPALAEVLRDSGYAVAASTRARPAATAASTPCSTTRGRARTRTTWRTPWPS